jgi:hypothetical protein
MARSCTRRPYIFVQCQFTHWPKRKLSLRPNFGHIEDIPAIVLGLFGCHDLYIHCPRRKVSSIDGILEVFSLVIRILARDPCGFLICVRFDALICPENELHIVKSTIFLDKLVGMSTVSVDIPNGGRGSAIAEELHKLMDPFLVGIMEIPEHRPISEAGLRMPFV